MDDALLDDDGQFKDEEVEDELDEAALLGSSDEDVLDVGPSDDQALDYMETAQSSDDHDGVNSGIYQSVGSGNNEEDVLEVNIDADLDSFAQEDIENTYIEEASRKSVSQEVRYKENLISITLIPSEDENHSQKQNMDDVASREHSGEDSVHNSSVLLDDEESEDENFDDDHRERFRSERSNIITLTPAKKRSDIPDSLESVLNSEEKSKAQEFLENEKKRKLYLKSKAFAKEKSLVRAHVPLSSQFPIQNASPRKILINPHFGRNMPVSTIAPMRTSEPCTAVFSPHSNMTSTYGFQQPNYVPSEPNNSMYATGEVFSAPYSSASRTNFTNKDHFAASQMRSCTGPATIQSTNSGIQQFNTTTSHFNQPVSEMHPPHVGNQAMPYVWCQPPPPNLVSVQPQPPMSQNYIFPVPPAPVSTYSSSFTSPSYQGTFQTNMQQHVSKPESFTPSSLWNQTTVKTLPSMKQKSFARSMNSQKIQSQNTEAHKYHSQQQNKRNSHIHVRKLIKRSANFALKLEPVKRLEENCQRKVNFQMRKPSSNIKEIPLVETLPTDLTKSKQETQPAIDDEDEETKELRKKIEEQKKIREELLKRKEERRRQMALQRLQELKARQGLGNQSKLNVKNRVGLTQTAGTIINAKTSTNKTVQKVNVNKMTPKQVISIHARIGAKKVQPFSKPSVQVVGNKLHVNQSVSSLLQTSKEPSLKQTANKVPLVNPPSEVKLLDVQKSLVGIKRKFPNQSAQTKQAKRVKQHIGDSNILQKSQPFKKGITEIKQLRFPRLVRGSNIHSQRMPLVRGPGVHPNIMPPPGWFRFRAANPDAFSAPHFDGNRFNSNPTLRNRMPFLPPPNVRPEVPFSFPSRQPLCFELNQPKMDFYHARRFDGSFGNYRQRGLLIHPLRSPGHGFPPPPMPQFQNMHRHPRMPYYQPRCLPTSSISAERRRQLSLTSSKGERSQEKKQNVSSAVSNVVSDKNITAQPSSKQNSESQNDTDQQLAASQEDCGTKTKTVVVNNLSSSTTEGQLRKLGNTIGPIERIQLEKPERKAVIVFKEENHALKFQMKYQRYMLDLAMIEVSLQLEE